MKTPEAVDFVSLEGAIAEHMIEQLKVSKLAESEVPQKLAKVPLSLALPACRAPRAEGSAQRAAACIQPAGRGGVGVGVGVGRVWGAVLY